MRQFVYKITPVRPDLNETMTAGEEKIMTDHFQYLKEMHHQRRLFLAGPCLDAAFGLVIFDAESLSKADEIMRNDPVVARGLMKGDVHEFKVSLLRERDSNLK